jgi:hypothetical protein
MEDSEGLRDLCVLTLKKQLWVVASHRQLRGKWRSPYGHEAEISSTHSPAGFGSRGRFIVGSWSVKKNSPLERAYIGTNTNNRLELTLSS